MEANSAFMGYVCQARGNLTPINLLQASFHRLDNRKRPFNTRKFTNMSPNGELENKNGDNPFEWRYNGLDEEPTSAMQVTQIIDVPSPRNSFEVSALHCLYELFKVDLGGSGNGRTPLASISGRHADGSAETNIAGTFLDRFAIGPC